MSEQERQEPVVAARTGGPDEAVSLGDETGGPSVGERIRQGREAAGLSAADLAQPLNLDLKVIEHIERDELDAVPGRPYILAYLRSWATQLGLDADSLIAQYNAQRAPGSVDVQGGNYPTLDVMEPRGGGLLRRVFGWLVVLVLIGVAIAGISRLDTEQVRAWWADLRGESTETEVPATGDGGAVAPGDVEAERPPIEGGLEQPPAPPAEPVAEPVESAAPAEASRLPLPEQRLAAIDSATAPVEDNPAVTEPGDDAAPAGEPEAPAAATPALVLRATQADSWVEVRDGNGERLMYDVLAAGEERVFSDAQGPFSLVLGRPEGLEVEYQGEPVELDEPNEATGVLRTTVGSS